MIAKVVVALLCLTLNLSGVYCYGVCGTVGPIWRNDNQTCPLRAVCGDVFTFTRDWQNGTICNEIRILSNCLCPGNTVCPFHNQAHALRSGSSHEQYTCIPSCRLPWCSSVTSASTRGRANDAAAGGGHRPRHDEITISMTAEQQSPSFGRRNYYKMECRCAQHLQSAPPRQQAVRAYAYRYNWRTHSYSTVYICNDLWGSDMNDPC